MYRAVVPLKSLATAKSRLSPALSDAQRRALVLAMARDTLATLCASELVAQVFLLAGDAQLAAEFTAAGLTCIPDPPGKHSDLNLLLQDFVINLPGNRDDRLLVLHADLPLLCEADLQAVAAAHECCDVLIGSDGYGQGTNLLAFRQCQIPAFGFGAGSLERHRTACDRAQIAWRILERPGVSIDIDTPDDLEKLTAAVVHGRPVGRHTAQLMTGEMARRESLACIADQPGAAA